MAGPENDFSEYMNSTGCTDALWRILIEMDKLKNELDDPVEYLRVNLDPELTKLFASLKDQIQMAREEIMQLFEEYPKECGQYLKRKKKIGRKRMKKGQLMPIEKIFQQPKLITDDMNPGENELLDGNDAEEKPHDGNDAEESPPEDTVVQEMPSGMEATVEKTYEETMHLEGKHAGRLQSEATVAEKSFDSPVNEPLDMTEAKETPEDTVHAEGPITQPDSPNEVPSELNSNIDLSGSKLTTESQKTSENNEEDLENKPLKGILTNRDEVIGDKDEEDDEKKVKTKRFLCC